MKINCAVIKDLLPLYAENMASSDTVRLVDAHIAECENCRNTLEEMKALPVIHRDTGDASLKRVEKGIRSRRFRAALVTFFTAAVLLVSAYLRIYTPEYLSAEEAIESVTVDEAGFVSVKFTDAVQGSDFQISEDEPEKPGRSEITLIAWKYRFWDVRQSRPLTEDFTLRFPVDRVWYSAVLDGEEDTLLLGDAISGGRITLPRLFLSYYFMLSLVAASVCTLLTVLLRRRKISKHTVRVAVFCWCYCVCSILVTEGNFVSHHAKWLFTGELILSLLFYGALINAYYLWKLHRQDKNM